LRSFEDLSPLLFHYEFQIAAALPELGRPLHAIVESHETRRPSIACVRWQLQVITQLAHLFERQSNVLQLLLQLPVRDFEHLKLENLLFENNLTGGNSDVETGYPSSKCCILLEIFEEHHRLSGEVFHGGGTSGANANGLTWSRQG
jgi:hypothetical protein